MDRNGVDALQFHERHPHQKEGKTREKEEDLGDLADDGPDRDLETVMEQKVCIAPVEVKALEMFVENQPVTHREQEKETLLFPKNGTTRKIARHDVVTGPSCLPEGA